MVEPEIAFCGIEEDMVWAENLIEYIIDQVLKNRSHELSVLGRDITLLDKIKPPFPRISYSDAIELLQKNNFNIKWGEDFGASEDTYIS